MLHIWQAFVVDLEGDVQPGASVTIKNQYTGATISVYSDSAGSAGSNPITADSDGYAYAWVPCGLYRIEIGSGGSARILDSVVIGNPVLISATEIAALVDSRVTRMEFAVGDVSRYCTAATTNHQQAFDDAQAVSDVIYAPSGTWNVDRFLMDVANKKLRTDGFATIIHQRTGNTSKAVIHVCASGVTLEHVKITGNIATDTGEHNHAILVTGDHPVNANINIQNVTIGNVWAQDVRGDAVYLGAPASSTNRNLKVGVIRGTNIYRNVLSVVGGCQGEVTGVTTDGGCGYETVDIEPDSALGPSTDIRIGWVRGGNIQCAPPAGVARRVWIGTADLDPAYQPNSTPGYSEGGSSYAIQIRSAVQLRNTIGFRIDYLRIRDHGYFGINYIYNGGETLGQNISIGYLDSSGVGGSESTINALLNLAAVQSFTLEDGNVALQSPTTDAVMIGDSSGTIKNKFIVDRLYLDGRLARYCSNGRFNEIIRNDTNNISLLLNCDNCVLQASDITAPQFISFTTGLTVISSAVTCSGTYIGSTCSNIEFIACSGGLASILAGSATYDPASLADGAGVTTTLTMTGLAVGDYVKRVSFGVDLQGITLTGYVKQADQGAFRFQNESGFTVDLNSATLAAQGAKK